MDAASEIPSLFSCCLFSIETSLNRKFNSINVYSRIVVCNNRVDFVISHCTPMSTFKSKHILISCLDNHNHCKPSQSVSFKMAAIQSQVINFKLNFTKKNTYFQTKIKSIP